MLENSDSIGHRFYNCLLESSDEGPMPLLDGCSFLEELLGVEGCLQRIKEGSSSSREIKKELIDGFCEDSVTATYLDHFLLCHLPAICPGMSKEDITGESKKKAYSRLH